MAETDAETDDDAPTESVVDETPNAADPASFKRQRKKKQLIEDVVSGFWSRAMQDPGGRLALWRLLLDAGTFTPRFACSPNGAPYSESTWFQAGEQSFGLRLYRTLMKVDQPMLHQMHVEHDPDFAKPKPVTRSENV